MAASASAPSNRSSTRARRSRSSAARSLRPRASARAISRVSRALSRTSTRMPSRFWPVSARICVRPTALSRLPGARASSRPPLSRKTSPSRTSASISASSAARSTRARQRAVRSAVATTPPGENAYRAWALPAAARRANSSSRSGSQANGSGSGDVSSPAGPGRRRHHRHAGGQRVVARARDEEHRDRGERHGQEHDAQHRQARPSRRAQRSAITTCSSKSSAQPRRSSTAIARVSVIVRSASTSSTTWATRGAGS